MTAYRGAQAAYKARTGKIGPMPRSAIYPKPRMAFRTGGYISPESTEERKVIDVGANTYADVLYTGQLVLLNGVAQGTDFTNRVGRKVQMKSVQLRGSVFPNSTSHVAGRWDLYLILDMQANAAAPNVTDIISANTGSNSFINLNNRDRFKVLVHRFGFVGAASGGDTAAPSANLASGGRALEIYKSLNHEVIFGGTGATIGSIQSNALYALMITDGGAAGEGMDYEFAARVRFTDA